MATGFKVDTVFVDFLIDFEDGERGARRINVAMAKLGKVSGVAADAQDRVAKSTKKAGAATRAMAKDTKKMGTASKDATGQIKGMIKTLLGLEVARRVVRALLTTFLGFRTAMNNVRAITNATDADFARLTATAKELGRTTQFTATDAAEAMAFLARTGLDVNETIGVLPATLNLAAATAVDLGTAADIATNILMGMGLQISDLEGVIDVLAFTTNRSNVNIFELSEAMKLVAPIASDAGVSIARLSAMIGILGDAGIKGTLAGTALRKSILQIQTGAGTAGEVLAGLGIQVQDASGNFIGLDQVLRAVEGGLVSDTELFKVFGLRAISAAKVLAGRGVAEIDKFTAAIERSAGTAERMADQQMAGLVGATRLLTSATESTAIAWGEALEPALSAVADALRVTLIPLLNGIVAAFQAVGVATFVAAEALMFGFATAAEGVGVVIGFMMEKFGSLLRLIGEAGERFLPMDSALSQLSSGLANFGSNLERIGVANQRRGLGAIEGNLARLKFAWQAAGEQIDDIADDFSNLTDEADETADAIDKVNVAVTNTAAAMQRARTQLNLDVFTEQLEAIRALLREAFGLEGEGAFGSQENLEIQRQLVPMMKKQRDALQELLEAERGLAGVLADVLRLEQEIVDAGEDQEKVAELTTEWEQAISQLAAATRDADQAMEDLGKTAEKTGSVLNQITLAVRGLNRIADAFGLMNDDVRRAIDSVLDLIRTFKALEAAKGALSAGTVLGLAGAAAGLISAAVGVVGGKDPEAKRARENALEASRANTLAMEQLRLSFEKSLAVLNEFTGAEIERAGDLLTRHIGVLGMLGNVSETNPPDFDFELLSEEELEFLQRVADAFKVTLDGSIESFERLQEAINQLDLKRLTEDFTGAMTLLQRRFAIFDVDDPIDRLQAMFDLLEQFGDLEDGPDVPRGGPFDLGLPITGSEAGRAALDEFIRNLFEQIEAGTFDVARLGGLTLSEFLDLLGSMESLLDDIAEDEAAGIDADEGLTENFVRSTRITEVQGNELLNIGRTGLEIDRLQLQAQLRMVDILGGMAGIAAPPMVASAVASSRAPINVGGVSVQANFAVTEAVDVGQLVDRVGSDLATIIDQRLSERQTREGRAVGDTGRTA